MRIFGLRGLCIFALLCTTAATLPAVTIVPDYTGLGTVYQDAAGQLYTAAGAGRSDITNVIIQDINAAINYLQGSILVPWTENISYNLGTGAGNVGEEIVNTLDANNRPNSATINFSLANNFFVDSSPYENSEFSMSSLDTTACCNGDLVNVSRFGDANAGGPAAGRWDFLTIAIHETEHAIGFDRRITRFTDVAGANTDPNRSITIPTTLTGLANDFTIPIVTGSSHIDGTAQGGIFNDAVVADPGFNSAQRALPTGAEIYALCVIEGCSANQVNPELAATPEPLTMTLVPGALAAIWLLRRKSRIL